MFTKEGITMQISPIKFERIINNNVYPNNRNQKSEYSTNDIRPEYAKLSGSEIPFCAIKGVKVPKFTEKKLELLKIIQARLQEIKNQDMSNIIQKEIKRLLKELYLDAQDNSTYFKYFMHEDPKYTAIENYLCNLSEIILQKAESIQASRVANDKNDYNLLNKFKAAVASDDMNLDKVYKSYYSKLNELSSVEEIQAEFPKIRLPKSPIESVTDKIVASFDRDFIENYIHTFVEGRVSDAKDSQAVSVILQILKSKLSQLAQESGLDEQYIKNTFLLATNKKLMHKMELAAINGDYKSFLRNKNQSMANIISPEEKQLLSVDYDKYVLSILRQLYVEGKKLSEVSYKEGDIVISPQAFKNLQYKFEKPNEKDKDIVRKALKIQQAERNYECFGNEQLQERLKHYGNSSLSENEEILNRLVDFASSMFTKEDKEALVPFLRILDDVSDGKISINEAIDLIKSKNLQPHGTIMLNKVEKERVASELSAERKQILQYNSYCAQYNSLIDKLYQNKLDEIATICSSYSPQIYKASRDVSDKIMQTILKYINDDKITSPKKLEHDIKSLNRYYELKLYKTEEGSVLKEAIEYATDSKGVVDEVKAGKYIIANSSIKNYPACLANYVEDFQDVVSIICQRYSPQEATLKLMKLDDFIELPISEQLKITKILEKFNLVGENNDKQIIEAIVNNIYTQKPTTITTSLNKEQTIFKDSMMLPSAKLAIIEDKKFPLCLEYFEEFERAMGRAAQSKEEDGIQVIGSSNKALRKLYKQEVKISKDERLYSTNEDYVFDVYKPGLHKSKTTKA